MRVSAVIEKCSDRGSDGGLRYDVRISRGLARPETVFERRSVAQPDLTRWRRVFSLGEEPPRVDVRHDAVALAAAGVIPIYDFTIRVPEKAIEEGWRRWQASRRDLFENGLLTAYFGTTGGRPDLGPLPAWTVLYILSMDPRQKEIMLGNDELSGGIPIHARSAATGRVPSWEDRPRLWLADSRAGNWGTEGLRLRPDAPRQSEPVPSIFSPDCAHLPSLAYLPYVVTGDLYFLEESYFWASYVVFHDNPGYAKGLIYDGQLRGRAWGLRTVATAAAIAPDAHPEKEHLSRRVTDTLESYAALLGSPEAPPLGMLTSERREKRTTYAPWQHDFMVMAADFAAICGFGEAEPLRRRLLDFSLGRFTNAPDFDPACGAGYWWTIADEEAGFRCTTWKELAERNCSGEGEARADGSRDSRSSLARNDYAGGYSDLALAAAAIGVRTGHPEAPAARDFLLRSLEDVVAQRPANPPFAMGAGP